MADYDLRSVKLPRADGALLRLLVTLAEMPLTAPLVAPGLLKPGGLYEMRTWRYDETPTFMPIIPHPDAGQPSPPLDLNSIAFSPSRSEPPLARAGERGPGGEVRRYASAYRSGDTTPIE